MTRSRPGRCRSWSLAASLALSMFGVFGCHPPELVAGKSEERRIAPGESHRFSLILDRDSLVEVEVDQDGVDVVTRLADPQGSLVLEVDRNVGYRGRERLLAVTAVGGRYTLTVRAFDSYRPPGKYRIEFQRLRPVNPRDHDRARSVELISEGLGLRAKGQFTAARETLEAALDLSRRSGDRLLEAESLDGLALVLQESALRGRRLGDNEGEEARDGTGHGDGTGGKREGAETDELEAAGRLYEESSALYRTLGDPSLAGWTLIRAGETRFQGGKLLEAADRYREALDLLEAAGGGLGAAIGLRNLGQIYRIQGRWQDALSYYNEALEFLDEGRDLENVAGIHHNLGVLYRVWGENERAANHLQRAQELWAQLEDDWKQATSLNQWGEVLHKQGKPREALEVLGQALELRGRVEDLRGQAKTLVKMGGLFWHLDRPEDAEKALVEALGILDDLRQPNPDVEASALLALGSLYAVGDDPDRALLLLGRALAHYRSQQDPVGQAESLLGISRGEARKGRLGAARQAGAEALDLVEGVRMRTLIPRLRSTFFSTVQHFFEAQIDVLMRSHGQDPAAGFDALALEISERARMRTLVEMLAAGRGEASRQAAPALVRREQRLRQELNELVERQLDLANVNLPKEGPGSAQEVARGLAGKLIETEDALEEVQLEILRDSPRYGALVEPKTASLAEIQGQVLDQETLLMEYHLGSERSYLWLVSPESLHSFELPGRSVLEPLVWQVRTALAENGPRGPSSRIPALDLLSRALLRPALDHLKGRRLAIVPDGVLHYLPFAALPDPAPGLSEGRPLVVEHEITIQPSASVLAEVRREFSGRPPAPGLLAVLADPVFDRWDPRLRSLSEPPAVKGPRPVDSLPRLSFSGDEAEQILALVPPRLSLTALGFEATRDLVLEGKLAGYQILHLATHVKLQFGEQKTPAILLSGVGRDGQDKEGRLFSHDLYSLDLPAELVVLSGCSTALGEEVRGEGLVGLSRGLMYAGAERVVGSLWDVNDVGSVPFMASFYRYLLAGATNPAAALRQAQIEHIETGKPPFLWAPYVLQGDWRGWPALAGAGPESTPLK